MADAGLVGDLGRYFVENRVEVVQLVGEHLYLVGVSVAVAIGIGVPLGIGATRNRALERPIIGTVNVFQTIPSLALFGFLIPIPLIGGVGARTAIVALVLYALLPIVRNTHAGIRGIDPALLEAARGMGMTGRQRLFKVELPLAASVILAGIRVAAVVSVGIATIAAAIGAGGLGVYIFRGIAVVDDTLILAGALPAALLALAADGALGWLGRRLAPPGAPGAGRGEVRPV